MTGDTYACVLHSRFPLSLPLPIISIRDGSTTEQEEFAVELSESDVLCITLNGNDEAYGAGADLGEFDGDASDARKVREEASILHDAIIQFHQAEIPVVSAVNGVAAGAGFSMALFPDIVLVSDEARLEYADPRIGFTGDGGSTFFLPRLVGLRKAKEIVLLDEPITPEEAVELGIATGVVPAADLESRRDDVAQRLASGPTTAYGATKRLMTESFDRNMEGQLAAETEQIARAARTEDYERGYEAFFGQEEPDFTGR